MPEQSAENIELSEKIAAVRSHFIWALSLFVTIIVLLIALSLYTFSEPNLNYERNIITALQLIGYFYDGPYHPISMMRHAREAVFDDLDRYSSFLEPQQLKMITEEFSGSYSGIGVTIVPHEQGLMVLSVREGGPASKAGVLNGDIFIKADSINLAEIDAFEASSYLRGPENSQLTLTIARDDMRDTLTVTVVREKLKLQHIPYAGMLEDSILYVRLIDFEAGASEDVEHILDSVLNDSSVTIKGMILDLQNNPGGLLYEAIGLADLFLPSGELIVGVKGRSRWDRTEYNSSKADMLDGRPLAILVDGGSASASEIVSGSLKYAGRAFLVGDTTFGKGLVQEYKGLADGSGIRLTSSRYYFKGEKYINDPNSPVLDSAGGIPPDYYVPEINEPFLNALARTLLMRQFATSNKDRILAGPSLMKSADDWYDNFIKYCEEKDFKYISATTGSIDTLMQIAELSGAKRSTIGTIDRTMIYSEKLDLDQFIDHREEVVRRLYRLAVESKYGLARSYRDAVLPYSHQIKFAEKLIDSLNAARGNLP